MYNNVLTSLLPVEAPLLRSDLEKIDKALQQGVKNINWKSPEGGGGPKYGNM